MEDDDEPLPDDPVIPPTFAMAGREFKLVHILSQAQTRTKTLIEEKDVEFRRILRHQDTIIDMLHGDMRDLTNMVDTGCVSSANVVAGPLATAAVAQSRAVSATMSEQLQYELDSN